MSVIRLVLGVFIALIGLVLLAVADVLAWLRRTVRAAFGRIRRERPAAQRAEQQRSAIATRR